MHGKREFLISFKPGFASKQHFLKIHADTTRKAKKKPRLCILIVIAFILSAWPK